MPEEPIYTEENKKKLEQGIQMMLDKGMSEDDIKSYALQFREKYGAGQQKSETAEVSPVGKPLEEDSSTGAELPIQSSPTLGNQSTLSGSQFSGQDGSASSQERVTPGYGKELNVPFAQKQPYSVKQTSTGEGTAGFGPPKPTKEDLTAVQEQKAALEKQSATSLAGYQRTLQILKESGRITEDVDGNIIASDEAAGKEYNQIAQSTRESVLDRAKKIEELQKQEVGIKSQMGSYGGFVRNESVNAYTQYMKGVSNFVLRAADAVAGGNATADEITKITEDMFAPFREQLSTSETTREYAEKIPFIPKALGGAAAQIPTMITPYASGIFFQSYATAADEVADMDLSPAEKEVYKLTSATVEAALERVALGKVLKNNPVLKKFVVGEVMSKVAKEGAQESAETLAAKSIDEVALRYGKDILKGGAAEGLTGAAQEASNIALKEGINAITKGEGFKTDTMLNYTKQVLEAGAAEAVGGIGLTTAFSSIAAFRDGKLALANAQDIKTAQMVATPEGMTDFTTAVDAAVESEQLTPEDGESIKEAAGQFAETVSKIPEEYRENPKVIELVAEKQNLIAQNKTLDPAFQEKNKAKIEAIDNELLAAQGIPTEKDETQATEAKPEAVRPEESQESSVKQAEEVTGKEIEPHKEVSISQANAIKDVVGNLNTDLKDMEASALFSKFKDTNDVLVIKEGTMAHGLMRQLEEKGYVETDYYDEDFKPTEKGREYIDRVKKRIETRKAVKLGVDLFPELAAIPEFVPMQQAIQTSIDNEEITTDGIEQYASKAEQELEGDESIVAAIESQAASADPAERAAALEQADEFLAKVEAAPKESFYTYDAKEGFVEQPSAQPVGLSIDGDFFAVKGKGGYTISEGRSGAKIVTEPTLKLAIESANNKIAASKRGLPIVLNEQVGKTGLSPRYAENTNGAPTEIVEALPAEPTEQSPEQRLKDAFGKWRESKGKLGIAFDPKRAAKEDAELFNALIDYVKDKLRQGVYTLSQFIADMKANDIEITDPQAVFDEVEKPVKKSRHQKRVNGMKSKDLEARKNEAVDTINFLLDEMKRDGVKEIDINSVKAAINTVKSAKTDASLATSIARALDILGKANDKAKERSEAQKKRFTDMAAKLTQQKKDLEARKAEAVDFANGLLDEMRKDGVKDIPTKAVQSILGKIKAVKTDVSLDRALADIERLLDRVYESAVDKETRMRREKLQAGAKANAKANKFGDFAPAYAVAAMKEVPPNLLEMYDVVLANIGVTGPIVLNTGLINDFYLEVLDANEKPGEAKSEVPVLAETKDDLPERTEAAKDVSAFANVITDDGLNTLPSDYRSMIRELKNIPAAFMSRYSMPFLKKLMGSVLNAQNGVMQGNYVSSVIRDYNGKLDADKILGAKNVIGRAIDSVRDFQKVKVSDLKKNFNKYYSAYVDSIIKGVKGTPVYEAINSITAAKSAAKKAVQDINTQFQAKYKSAVRSRIPAVHRPFAKAAKVYTDLSAKVQIYLRELERVSNPDAKLTSIADIIDNIKENRNDFTVQMGLTDTDVDNLIALYESLDMTSPETILKSFNKQERELVEFMLKTNSETLTPMFQTLNIAYRNNPQRMFHNYSFRSGSMENETIDESHFDAFNGQGMSRQSFKGASSNKRSNTVDFIGFNPLSDFINNVEAVTYDYYMTPVVSRFNSMIESIKEQGNKDADAFASALRDGVKQMIDLSFKTEAMIAGRDTWGHVANKVLRNIGRSMLITPVRLVSEFLFNSPLMAIASGKKLAETAKGRKEFNKAKALDKIQKDFGSVQIGRVGSNKLDLAETKKTTVPKRFKTEDANAFVDFIENNYVERASKWAQSAFYAVADMAARPIWEANFLTEFRKLTGTNFNATEFVKDDNAYKDDNKRAIETAKAKADQKVNTLFNTAEPMEAKLNQQMAKSRGFWSDMVNNFMQSFSFNEQPAIKESFKSIFGKGIYNPVEGFSQVLALSLRAFGYQFTNALLFSLIAGLISGDDDDEFDAKNEARRAAWAYTFLALLGNKPMWMKGVISTAVNLADYLMYDDAEAELDDEGKPKKYNPYEDAPLFAPNVERGGLSGFFGAAGKLSMDAQSAWKANDKYIDRLKNPNYQLSASDLITTKMLYANSKLMAEMLGLPAINLMYPATERLAKNIEREQEAQRVALEEALKELSKADKIEVTINKGRPVILRKPLKPSRPIKSGGR